MLISSDIVNELAQLEVETAGEDEIQLEKRRRMRDLETQRNTNEQRLKAKINEVRSARCKTETMLVELRTKLFNLDHKGKCTSNVFDTSSGQCDPNRDPAREVYHAFEDYRQTDGYKKIMQLVTKAQALQPFVDRVQACDEAMTLSKEKLERYKSLVEDGNNNIRNTIYVKLLIPGDDSIAKEVFKTLKEALEEPIKALETIIKNKSVMMFENIVEQHATVKTEILQKDVTVYLEDFKGTLEKVNIAVGQQKSPFEWLVGDVGRVIKRKVKDALDQKESMRNFARNKANVAEANATKMIREAVAERTDQILVDSDSESMDNYLLWQEHKKSESNEEDTRKIRLSSVEEYKKLQPTLRKAIQHWNHLSPKDKDGESGKPLLARIRAAVAAKILDEEDIPWLEAKTSNKQAIKNDKPKVPLKRKRWSGSNAWKDTRLSTKAKK